MHEILKSFYAFGFVSETKEHLLTNGTVQLNRRFPMHQAYSSEITNTEGHLPLIKVDFAKYLKEIIGFKIPNIKKS